MAPATPHAPDDDSCATTRVDALSELWLLIAAFSDFVGAWRLTGVCKASIEGAKVWLRTLPGLLVCGGYDGRRGTRKAWRLDLWDTSDGTACLTSRVPAPFKRAAWRGGASSCSSGVFAATPGNETTASVEISGY
jgi:hypothetical protein